MRFDRALTVYLVHPAQRAVPTGSHRGLPILMYHSISDEPERGRLSYFRINTGLAVFKTQMHFLQQHGYQTILVSEAVNLLSKHQWPQAPTVVITFDDGYRNFYTRAFAVLQEYGFTATLLLPTNYIQSGRAAFQGVECMTWNEVRELSKAGIEIGSHTMSHPRLVDLNWTEMEKELRESKNELEDQSGTPVTSFAYPFAFPQADRIFVRRFRDLLFKTDYRCCLTTEVGLVHPGDDAHRLKRLPINSEDDVRLFQAKLDGGYDWLGIPQWTFKMLRHCCKSDTWIVRSGIPF